MTRTHSTKKRVKIHKPLDHCRRKALPPILNSSKFYWYKGEGRQYIYIVILGFGGSFFVLVVLNEIIGKGGVDL